MHMVSVTCNRNKYRVLMEAGERLLNQVMRDEIWKIRRSYPRGGGSGRWVGREEGQAGEEHRQSPGGNREEEVPFRKLSTVWCWQGSGAKPRRHLLCSAKVDLWGQWDWQVAEREVNMNIFSFQRDHSDKQWGRVWDLGHETSNQGLGACRYAIADAKLVMKFRWKSCVVEQICETAHSGSL